MTYSLPFGLKQKPLNHYFEHGVIKFSIQEGKLFFTIKVITKLTNGPIQQAEVKSKAQLDQLLSIKKINDIRALEVVPQ